MSAIQINLSPDLAQLEAEGFRLRVEQGAACHLLVDGVPAVNQAREIVFGTIYTPLVVDGNGRAENPCSTHQCWWIGPAPCDATGRVMEEMISNAAPEDKGDGITTSVAFSRMRGDKKPYADYYEKIWTYVDLIWHEAKEIDPNCDPRSERPIPAVVNAQEAAFHYPDMATTRAGIGASTAKLLAERIAIVGLGGTGSYILDLVAKIPIKQIHLFDGDVFELHNAFRAPGAPSKEDFTKPKKVDWFGVIYERMHRGIVRHSFDIGAANLSILEGFDFVFVAIDAPEARRVILNGLIAVGVPFVDVGMDVALDAHNALRGMCRFTVGTPEKHDHINDVVSFATGEHDGVYRNIQVADLNMLNAALAVIKWKKLRGFYSDDFREHHSLYTVPTHGLTREDRT